MASRTDGKAVSAEELGKQQEIPHGFLQAILADLRRAGIVMSQRGQSGGWRMGRSADDVSVADVIRAVDGPLVSVYGLRPEAVSYNETARCSNTSGSPPAGRCATSSSRCPSSSWPTASCRRRSLRTGDEDAWQPHYAEIIGSGRFRLSEARRWARVERRRRPPATGAAPRGARTTARELPARPPPRSAAEERSVDVRRARRVGREARRSRGRQHVVAAAARPWPTPRPAPPARRGRRRRRELSAISRGWRRPRGRRRCRGRQRNRSASGPTRIQRPPGVAGAGGVGDHHVQPVGHDDCRSQRPGRREVELVGEEAHPAVGHRGQHDDVHLGPGQAVDQQRDLVPRGAREQPWPTTAVSRCLRARRQILAPSALDVLAAQTPGAVLAAQLHRGSERLVRRTRGHPDADRGELVAVLLQGSGEHRYAGVREPDEQEGLRFGHGPRVARPGHEPVNLAWTPDIAETCLPAWD